MIFPLKNIGMGLVLILLAFVVIDLIRFHIRIRKGKILAANAVAYEQKIPKSEMKILILGDSTALGTGAETPDLSTAGRLGKLYPRAHMINRAKNGLKITELLDLVSAIPREQKFSIILVQIGANDIIRLSDLKKAEKDLTFILKKLSIHTDKLIILHSGNIAHAKIFPVFFRPILARRSYQMREIYKKLTTHYGVKYVDLIASPTDKLLKDHATTYYAKDFLHLNGAGYGLWFSEIEKFLY